MTATHKPSLPAPLAGLGGGEMAERTRNFDWSTTSLGPMDTWPQSLRSALSICLNSNFPIALYWGPELRLLYNDEWRPIPGDKHPRVLGRPARDAWPEIWDIIEPLFQQVMMRGEAIRSRDQLLPMHRHGFTEECYFDYTFSPIHGEDGSVAGVFNAVIETTRRVIGERRLRTLRELAARTLEDSRSAEEACAAAARILAVNPHDLPFALLYVLSDDGRHATLVGHAGVEPGTGASPIAVDLGHEAGDAWGFRRVAETATQQRIYPLPSTFPSLPGGAWPEACEQAVVLPMTKPGQAALAGFIVAGISPRLALDDEYLAFLGLLASHVATTLANARAYEEERRRAEALAALDQAKTAFFSNVSHEFRTPLTLMLGPIEDLLTRHREDLAPAAAEQLTLVNRNGLRLLRLVNNLLDFSRIEAGRSRALFRPTDLAEFTRDLASMFRSAVERAGMRLVTDCPPLGEPVFVDREMWEKVVMNLMSNAFKFTFDGEIAVSLHLVGKDVELRVRDTGTGIAADEMPRLFERFHRIENARGRTHEGSGIGLALVQELVKLHGGSIAAESVPGKGTTFVVLLPRGRAHLPASQIGDDTTVVVGAGPQPYVEEALRWLPGGSHDEWRDGAGSSVPAMADLADGAPDDAHDSRPRVLVADDNADMRHYVTRLLARQFRVEAVPDGADALAAVRRQVPDLLLTDVMMPNMNGFELLQAVRSDPRATHMPVIMLSARAGEESRVEGVEAGADDYLVKPFSARELLARVGSHIQMARIRRESEQAIRASEAFNRSLMDGSADCIKILDLDGHLLHINEPGLRAMEIDDFSRLGGKNWADLWPADARHHVDAALASARAGTPYSFQAQCPTARGTLRWWDIAVSPVRQEADGPILNLLSVSRDITDRKLVEEQLQRERDRLQVTLASIGDGVVTTDADGRVSYLNHVGEALTGWTSDEASGLPLSTVFNIVNEETRLPAPNPAARALKDGVVVGLANHTLLIAKDGSERPIDDSAAPIRDANGAVVGCVLVFRDVSERRRAEEALQASEERFQFVRRSSGVGFWYCDLPFDVLEWDDNVKSHFHLPLDATVTLDTFYARLHPDDREPTRAAIEKSIAEHQTYDVDYRTVDPATGSMNWIRAIGRTVYAPDGTPIRFDGVTVDITARKEADAALRERELRYQLISQAAHDAIWDWDLQSNKVVWNEGLSALFGFPPDQVRYDASWWVEHIHPDDRKRIADGIHAAIDGTDKLWSDEYRFMRADGTYASVFDRGHIVREGGKPVRMVGAMLDLSERERLENELRQVAANLADANRKKDEFLATLAHELRNPLAPISNALQVMKLSNQRELGERARSLIERQLGQMVRLVDDLMDVSRISRGKIQLRTEHIDLADVIRSAVETSRPLIEQMGHELVVDLPDETLVVDADLIRLAQVFLNLLNNAAKYSERGGRIRLSAARSGKRVVVSVEDNGIGIPSNQLDSIFEMFSQVDQSLEKAQGGLGIGLTLVQRLVELHGGRVEAHSEGPGHGAEFVVWLPLADGVQTAEPARGTHAETTPPFRILIVDDNRDGADSLALSLGIRGAETRTAYDGEQGLALAQDFCPDVVLLDIGLPKLNGYEACRRMRQQPSGRNAFIVAITGWGQDEDRQRAFDAGFDYHMVKPVDHNALLGLLGGLQKARR